MTDHPILFSAPMVRAILDGKKTQTRQVVRDRNFGAPDCGIEYIVQEHDQSEVFVGYGCDPDAPRNVRRAGWRGVCPYGKPGDRLWVKETFFPAHLHRGEPKFAAVRPEYIYAADYQDRLDVVRPHHWRPSIFCGRKASRITLEVVSVRVERLQDIDGADALAEGMETLSGLPTISAVMDYAQLWDTIHVAGAWAQNPWVWVLTFRRVQP